MTVTDLYNWAIENSCEHTPIVLSSTRPGWLNSMSLQCGPDDEFIELIGRECKYIDYKEN